MNVCLFIIMTMRS